ncbi:MAG: alpha-1,4-glucan:maltose-1-phosphate maltosyltransferase [Pseudomonadota bacterium]
MTQYPQEGRRRVVIERVRPEVDAGRFAIKRAIGERVEVSAAIFCDGHDHISAAVRYRFATDADWLEAPMEALLNDRWQGAFTVDRIGTYEYVVAAWIDPFLTWRHDLLRRTDAADIALALQSGALLVSDAGRRAGGPDGAALLSFADRLASVDAEQGRALAAGAPLEQLMARHAERRFVQHGASLRVTVDPVRARFSSWYELFPRSCSPTSGVHGTFADCATRLPDIARMGFDVVYLPPIHPIGRTFRKGPNNALAAGPDDVGSPWAIGGPEGGHKAIHPALGTLDDFRTLVARAREANLEIALDIALQCSPDHPYVREHPAWFRHRPDGSIQYAENPPKKYQDIYPFDFETDDWQGLWAELRSIFVFWIEQGVRIFRVDNPHTKPFAFWEWLIDDIKRVQPEVIFLAEAFTRPSIMHRLAKLGFSQSYTYFTWRNTRQELSDYLLELTQHESREYFRPNLWPNTPDILPEFLQYGGRPAFMLRAALAATLGANYGLYGPAFELLEHQAREPGSEEYLDSEKYQLRHWELDRPDSLAPFITRLNRIRRENPAFQQAWNLRLHPVDNDLLLCYSKTALAADGQGDVLVMVANLDPHNVQSGWIELPLETFGMTGGDSFQAHDLLSDARFLWQGARQFVRLDPQSAPIHILRLRRRLRSERDFDYFQ